MADTKTNGKTHEEEEEGDWEYEDEEAEDYEWEYGSDEAENEDPKGSKDDQAEEQDLPDPFSSKPAEKAKDSTNVKSNGHSNGDDKKKKRDEETEEDKKHKKHHKKSRHLERMEVFKKKDEGEEFRSKKIHVRSKDPSRIARQFEKGISNSGGKHKGKSGKLVPPPLVVNQICKICGKEPYVVERIVAEKSWWHKNCFRCKVCNKSLTLDTYMSHEGILYCKPHHRELFQPKVVVREHDKDVANATKTQEAIERHKMQELRMETIIRENKPIDLGDMVVKSGRNDKYAGLEDLDVGSKFRMFERKSESPERERGPASDRFGIMEKLKRLQEGEELEDLLAEINEELPSEEEDEDIEPYMTNVQKKTVMAEKLFSEGGQDRRQKMAEERKKELKTLRQKLMAGTKDNLVEQFDDLLNASANKVKKTKVDVRSENAKKFREMFDKGQIPEGATSTEKDKVAQEKEAELELMRKGRRDQRDFFKKMESGQLQEEKQKGPKETLLVRKLKDITADDTIDDDMLEMAPLANRFSFFENFKDKEEERQKKKGGGRTSPTRDGDHGETDTARKECRARSILNKFKEMETRALNGEPEETVTGDDPDKPVMTALGFLGRLPGVSEKRRPNMKRFTPPRKLAGGGHSDSESEYSDSEYSYSDSYSSSSYSSDTEEEDETLKAIRSAARAKELRAKFEEWEQSQDAKEQYHQMLIYDENGETLDTANNLRAKFEALQMQDTAKAAAKEAQKFRVKRFK